MVCHVQGLRRQQWCYGRLCLAFHSRSTNRNERLLGWPYKTLASASRAASIREPTCSSSGTIARLALASSLPFPFLASLFPFFASSLPSTYISASLHLPLPRDITDSIRVQNRDKFTQPFQRKSLSFPLSLHRSLLHYNISPFIDDLHLRNPIGRRYSSLA